MSSGVLHDRFSERTLRRTDGLTPEEDHQSEMLELRCYVEDLISNET